jgi:group I intron endonuclease
MNDYTVYVHITPNNKMYIGITHLKPNYRYGKDGNGYSGCTLFWRAIQKYGWNNIKHIVLFENLSKEVACECEKYLIAKYQTNNPQFGYNNSKGGDSGSYGHKMSEESKAKISKAMKGRKLSEETKRKVGEANSKALKGRHVADDVKKKISEHTKGKNNPFYGKHHTEESKKKISEALKGNKPHLGHKHSEEAKRKMSLAKKGKPLSEAQKAQLKRLHEFNKGRKKNVRKD